MANTQSYDLTGVVDEIGDTEQIKNFTKRNLIITVPDGQYPQTVLFEFVQGNTAKLDNLRIGQNVTVSFNIKGRRSGDRVYNQLQGWKVS